LNHSNVQISLNVITGIIKFDKHKLLGNMASKKHFLPVVAKGSGPTPGFE